MVAQALRPARIINTGKSAPMKGSSTIRARLIGGSWGILDKGGVTGHAKPDDPPQPIAGPIPDKVYR
ncbi:hypothetical protein MASR2M50_03910 [Thauera sp.]